MPTVSVLIVTRIPYALQWMRPIPLIIGISFALESPWWLVRKGRNDEARKSLCRLTSTESEADIDNTLSMMRHTNELEKEIGAGTFILGLLQGCQSSQNRNHLHHLAYPVSEWSISNGLCSLFLQASRSVLGILLWQLTTDCVYAWTRTLLLTSQSRYTLSQWSVSLFPGSP